MNILVTGASKGLGLELTKLLLHQGHTVIAVNRTVSEKLAALKSQYSVSLRIVIFDLSQPGLLKSVLFTDGIGLKYPIHGYVNNAAMAYDDIVTNINLDRLEKMFKVNVYSSFLIVKYVIRSMLMNKIQGSIIHISSISVHTGYKGLSMYAATKGAIEAFSKNTAREWGSKGIRSNCIVAGFMETEMSSTLSESQKNRIYNRTALKKATSKTSVAETVIFLLGEGAKSITGQNIHVDSGTI